MLRKLYILVLSVAMLACDLAKEDMLAPGAPVENPDNAFFALQGETCTINPAAFDRLRGVTSIIISKTPQYGEAKFIENGFIFYKPADNLITSDYFSIEGQSQAGTKITQEIRITFVPDASGLPCFAGAVSDKAETTIDKPVEIDVLANDKACTTIDRNSISIELPPRNGRAEVVNQKVLYTPDKNYVGDDIFFYRVNVNNRRNPVAAVEVKTNR
ncbi:Ig-like domain-containing protein [Emticicia sp. 21SJ11W-3]|uniref:Ig-like domain-containing protein n=1 Tax=Emticicia sp. 21SJ11W-3 TaxID=2916755 RepID=UPI00209F4F27|nr:Ig-like domain-containing protein [Emticicia sp. 21SJ11W-3]UTA68984.1 Ig-like domain-containing protein [Emticicia sp. 21SJ11W-3]